MICKAQTSCLKSSLDFTIQLTRFQDSSSPMGDCLLTLALWTAQGSPKPGCSTLFAPCTSSSESCLPTGDGWGVSWSESNRSVFKPKACFRRSARTTSLRGEYPEATGGGGGSSNAAAKSGWPISGVSTRLGDIFGTGVGSSPSKGVSASASVSKPVDEVFRRGGGDCTACFTSPVAASSAP